MISKVHKYRFVLVAHAASAVLNFSENRTPEILIHYLDRIVSKLLVLLQNGKQMVQEGALIALAAVADSSQINLIAFFEPKPCMHKFGWDGCWQRQIQRRCKAGYGSAYVIARITNGDR